ncbi:Rubber oxygenase, partial [Lachnellula suecica]
MAIPNPFRRHDAATRHCWGYTFQWTPLHSSEASLHPLKFSYDVLGEECLDILDEISPPAAGKAKVDPNRDLYALLRDNAGSNEKLRELWEQVTTIPEWVDWEQIERGQDVFYRGAARVTEVLARTGGFSTKVAKRRMYETTQHILQVTSSLESIKPGGAGHASTIRVRLLHAAVRRRILALAKEKPAYYSVEEYGIPINDLDSIATISSFSSVLIWLGFPRQGVWMRPQEIKDYLALWRLVAHYIGTPTEHFQTPETAKAMMESILLSEVNPSPTSRVLANNIILSLQGQAPAYASREFLTASARWLNGNELGDALGLDRPGWYYWALFAGQCLFFNMLAWSHRLSASYDRKAISRVRKIFYKIIVENKTHGLGEETNFEFKYIPSFAKTSEELGEYEETGLKGGVERRNAVTFALGAGALGLVGLFGARVVVGI